MDGQTVMSRDEFISAMRREFEVVMGRVADAVNDAPDGAWINGSERQVCDLMNRFRQTAFQTALQMRTDSAESAFSPSGGPGDGQAHGQQGPAAGHAPDLGGPGRAVADASSRQGRRGKRPG